MVTCEADTPGLVQADCLYTIAELQARLKLGQSALRAARRRGLPVLRCGRRGYIKGSDIIQFLSETGQK